MDQNEEKSKPKLASKRSFDVAFLTGKKDQESASPSTSTSNKSAFTKYKDQKNNNEAAPPSPEEATPSMGLGGPFPPNLMQFPALRKLLDITGTYLLKFICLKEL